MTIKFTGKDILQITSTRKKTAEGYLEATSAITCVGVQHYNGRLFGRDSDDIIGVFRPPETVFHKDTIASARLKPLTREHPDEDVTSRNNKKLAVGTLGETVEPIGDGRLGAKIIITDEEIIKEVEDGTVETSAGYMATLIEEKGVHDGQEFDFKFDGPMIINHLAIVDKGRCGPSVKILDNGVNKMTLEEMKKFLTDAGIIDADGKKVSDGIDSKALEAIVAKALKDKDDADDKKDAKSKSKKAAKDKDHDEEDEDDKKDVDDSADVKATARIRSKLIADTAGLVDADKVHDMENRAILEEALKDDVKDISSKSDDYLTAVLDTIKDDRQKAANNKGNMSNGAGDLSDSGEPHRVLNALDAKKLEKK